MNISNNPDSERIWCQDSGGGILTKTCHENKTEKD